jgi:hypothetical protein
VESRCGESLTDNDYSHHTPQQNIDTASQIMKGSLHVPHIICTLEAVDETSSLPSITTCTPLSAETEQSELSSSDTQKIVLESHLQALFAEQTAMEMNDIWKWWLSSGSAKNEPKNSLSLSQDSEEWPTPGMLPLSLENRVVASPSELFPTFLSADDRVLSNNKSLGCFESQIMHSSVTQPVLQYIHWTTQLEKLQVKETLERSQWMSESVTQLEEMMLDRRQCHFVRAHPNQAGDSWFRSYCCHTFAVTCNSLERILFKTCLNCLPLEWILIYIWIQQRVIRKASRWIMLFLALAVLLVACFLWHSIKHQPVHLLSSRRLVCYPPFDTRQTSIEYTSNDPFTVNILL